MMLSDDLGEKKIVAQRPEFWHVGFVSSEKHCSEVFFCWVALSFRKLTNAKNLAFPGHVFVFTCLLNRKQANCLQCTVQSQNQIPELIEVKIWDQIVYIGYCDVKQNAQID